TSIAYGRVDDSLESGGRVADHRRTAVPHATTTARSTVRSASLLRPKDDADALAREQRRARRLRLKGLLDTKPRVPPRRGTPPVHAVGAEPAGADVVAEHRAKRVQRLGLEIGVLDREHQLDSFIEVPRHPVGAR